MSTRAYLVKLVRGRFLDAKGAHIIFQPVDKESYLRLIRRKVREEAIEYVDDPSLGELADVYEAVRCVASAEGWTMRQVHIEADRKRTERGDYEDGVAMFAVGESFDGE